jgi:hypothetical protein
MLTRTRRRRPLERFFLGAVVFSRGSIVMGPKNRYFNLLLFLLSDFFLLVEPSYQPEPRGAH